MSGSRLFLSHVHEQAPLAGVLKAAIEEAFLGEVSVFLSADSESLPPGSPWFQRIKEAISGADAILVLASSESLRKPWVNFEAGIGCAMDVKIIPLCHSGQRRGLLPRPFSDYEAVTLEDQASILGLFETISRISGFQRAPTLDPQAVLKNIEEAIYRGLRESRMTFDDITLESIKDHCKIYQAEELMGKLGEEVVDKDALNGKARFVELKGWRSHVVYGPYESLDAGDYVAFFRIRIDPDYPDMPLLLLEFCCPGEYERRVVSAGDFLLRQRYQVFGLRFTTTGGDQKEYRVLPLQSFGKIWIDFVARARVEDLPVGNSAHEDPTV